MIRLNVIRINMVRMVANDCGESQSHSNIKDIRKTRLMKGEVKECDEIKKVKK